MEKQVVLSEKEYDELMQKVKASESGVIPVHVIANIDGQTTKVYFSENIQHSLKLQLKEFEQRLSKSLALWFDRQNYHAENKLNKIPKWVQRIFI